MSAPVPTPPTEPVTAWTPRRESVFRTLWLTWLTAACAVMNDVAAAWAMATLTLPSGALDDIARHPAIRAAV